MRDAEPETPPNGGSLSPRAFRSQLRDLPPDEFRRFVAALWAGRGRATFVDGRAVVARRADGSRRRLLVVARPYSWTTPAEPRAPAVDGIVCPSVGAPVRALASAAGADVYGPDHLRRQLLHAVDGEERERLLSRFFDAETLRSADSPRNEELSRRKPIPDVGDALPVRLAAVVVIAALTASLLVGVIDSGAGTDPSYEGAAPAPAEVAERTAPGPAEVTGRTVDRSTMVAAERDLANMTPPCSRSAESVVQYHLIALRNDEAPLAGAVAPDDRYVHPDAVADVRRYAATGALPNRSAYAPLREFEIATFDFVRWSDETPSQRVAVWLPDGSGAVYRFDLAQYDPAPDRECWGLVAVERVG